MFIGYDERAPQAFQVAKHSLLKHTKQSVIVHKLDHRSLRKDGLFYREWKIDKQGQYIDLVDGRPFSTQFSHTRFLVPELWRNLKDSSKASVAVFVDCDFVFFEDIDKLFDLVEDNQRKYPLWCVNHNYKPSENLKMEGMAQSEYNKKLWSSLMVFDMNHEDNRKVTVEYVNSQDGRLLHQFDWLSNPLAIGSIPEAWNFLPNHSEKNTSEINGVHYTEGGPWIQEYKTCRYANLWLSAYEAFIQDSILNVNLNVEELL